ncbi:sulfur carrier protein ThiS [Haloferula sp. A504]|uniref:sulfur carrier protein ThiS n=1 Tax=Haloferula sp. A504 TaxID=3373601 RepID=UPI0031BC7B72|nr:sulfur carrier protein ThiS [Verrucomicrobiaceae bacterium E54]
MTLTLNGEARTFEADSLALEDLLKQLDLAGRPVVVEHNREPVLPGAYAGVTLNDGDSLEIVRIAAGG